MAKIVRLTESDLVRLVKKVLNEQHSEAGIVKDLANVVNSSSNKGGLAKGAASMMNTLSNAQSQPVKLTQDLINMMQRKFIMDFQKNNHLKIDGIVNGQTHQLMLKQGYFGAPQPQNAPAQGTNPGQAIN